MYANLIGQAKYRNMSDEDMGKVIGTTRQTYASKVKNGNFTCKEIKCLLRFFKKDFEYLFYEEGDHDA